MPHRIRLLEYSARELELLQQSMQGALVATDVGAEQRFRQRLQDIADCCRDIPDVMQAFRIATTAAVFAFANPQQTDRVHDLDSALVSLQAELRRARDGILESLG